MADVAGGDIVTVESALFDLDPRGRVHPEYCVIVTEENRFRQNGKYLESQELNVAFTSSLSALLLSLSNY